MIELVFLPFKILKMINKLWNKLKLRWGIDSNLQVLIILIAFSLAGPTSLFFHRKIDFLLGITDDSSFWLKVVVFIVIVLPIYNVFLFVYGVLLGQSRFFIKFFRDKFMLLKRIPRLFLR